MIIIIEELGHKKKNIVVVHCAHGMRLLFDREKNVVALGSKEVHFFVVDRTKARIYAHNSVCYCRVIRVQLVQ